MYDKDPTYVITLVHGTFARKAEWTKYGSSFRESIGKQLGDATMRRLFAMLCPTGDSIFLDN